MSLILGIHLLERIYLISDTRLSSFDGSSFEDDLIKAFIINSKISVVAAGKALAASFVLNKLKALTNEDTTIHELKTIIDEHLRSFISDYVNSTNLHSGMVALIFCGFNDKKVKRIESSRLGDAMSAMAILAQGNQVNQSIDNRLLNSFGQLSGKKKGDYITVMDVQDAELFSLTFDIRSATISKIKIAECYEYLIFHPDQDIKMIELPKEVISLLEFRDKSNNSLEDTLYQDAELVINFVRRVIRENNFSSVGGHIFPLLQTPFSAYFPTGDIGTIKKGKIVKAGCFYAENNKIMYELEDGTKGEYRHLQDLSKKIIGKNKTKEMHI